MSGRGVPSSRLVSTNLLDLWFERVVKPRLRGEAYMVQYLDDFVLCFQYRADALLVQKALCQKLGKCGLTLESSKSKFVEFGRFAPRHANKREKAMWLRSCAICNALLKKTRLWDSVRCQCGWEWQSALRIAVNLSYSSRQQKTLPDK
jgi:hypothetical protein